MQIFVPVGLLQAILVVSAMALLVCVARLVALISENSSPTVIVTVLTVAIMMYVALPLPV